MATTSSSHDSQTCSASADLYVSCSYDETSAATQRDIGQLAELEERYTDARDAYREALRHNPLNERDYTCLSSVLYQLGDFQGAYDAALEGCKLIPHDDCAEKLKLAHTSLGKPGVPQLPKLTSVVWLVMNKPTAFYVQTAALEFRRCAFREQSKGRESIPFLLASSALTQTGKSPIAPPPAPHDSITAATYLVTKATSLFKECAFEASIILSTAAIHLDPTGAGYYTRGLSYSASGDRESALRDFTESRLLEPTMENCSRQGMELLRRGQLFLAADAYTASSFCENTNAQSYLYEMCAKRGEGVLPSMVIGVFDEEQTHNMEETEKAEFRTNSAYTSLLTSYLSEDYAAAVMACSNYNEHFICFKVYFILCESLIRLQKCEEAIAAAKQATKVAINDEEREEALSLVVEATRRLRKRERDATVDYLSTADEDLSAAQLREKGNSLKSKGHTPKIALKAFSAAIRKEPDNPLNYELRSIVHSRLGNDISAAEDARKYIKLQPRDQRGHYLLGCSLMHQGLFEEARDSLSEALRNCTKYKDRVQVKEAVAECKELLEKRDRELQRIMTAPRVDTSAAPNQSAVDVSNEEPVLEEIEISGMSPEAAAAAYRLKGDTLLESDKSGSLRVAVCYYTKALELSPKDDLALCNRSLARCKMAMFKESAKDAAECVKLNPGNAKGQFRLGVARLDLGQAKEASKTFMTVLALLPTKSADRAEVEGYIKKCDGKRGLALYFKISVISDMPSRKGGFNKVAVEGEYPLRGEVVTENPRESAVITAIVADNVCPFLRPASQAETTSSIITNSLEDEDSTGKTSTIAIASNKQLASASTLFHEQKTISHPKQSKPNANSHHHDSACNIAKDLSPARACPQHGDSPVVAKKPQREKEKETPKPAASSSTKNTKIVPVKPTLLEGSGNGQSRKESSQPSVHPKRSMPQSPLTAGPEDALSAVSSNGSVPQPPLANCRQLDSPQTSAVNRPVPQSPLASNRRSTAAPEDASRAVRFDQDKQPLNFLSVLTGSKPTSPVGPACPAKYPLDASVTTNTRSPTAQTRRSVSTASPTGQSTSRSGSPAAPRFVMPVREQRSLIVADTCGLLRMDRKQLQSFANYLARTGEIIAMPFVVLSELDHIQKDFSNPELQYRARQARDYVRTLQEANYIRVQNGGESDNSIRSLTTTVANDDLILSYSLYLKKHEESKPPVDRRVVKVLTTDETLIIKAKGIDLGVAYPEDFN